jgi:trans-aconitate methyltransferase
MELSEAIELIRFETSSHAQTWADLGCGSGLFTRALASFLAPGSLIHAVDREAKALAEIPKYYDDCQIEKHAEDFTSGNVFFPGLDGYLMANSLHFVPYKESFLKATFESLKDGGLFVLVEYDLKVPNRWVPFPLEQKEAQTLFMAVGFKDFKMLRRRPSVYGSHDMYAAVAWK